MKLKGISGIEQHFDKAIVGGVGVIFIGVLAMQFLTQPNVVTVGKSNPLPPGEAYKPVESAAQALMGKLDPAAGASLLPEEPKISLLSQYQQKIQGGVAPRAQISMLGPAINLGDVAPRTGSTSNSPIVMAPVPAPASPAVYAYAGTVDPAWVVSHKEIRSILPAAQPYDKQWVSVEATFDGTAFKAALEADPDGETGPARAVPRGWYENSVDIVGVQLERQKLSGDTMAAAINGQIDPASESWSEASLVPTIPGMVDVVGDLVVNVKSMTDLAGALSKARANTDSVLRPEFFPTIAGPQWLPPSEARQAEATLGGKNPADALQERINDQERILKAIEKRMSDLSGGRPSPRGTTPDGREGGGGGGGGKGAPPPSGPSRPNQRNEKLQKQLEVQREQATKKIADAQKQLDQLKTGTNKNRTNDRKEIKPLLQDPAVRLWAHDATAEPGAVYRYRTRVVITSPLFGRTGLGDDSAAKSPVVYGQWSDWTDPVLVMPTEVYFVGSAQPRSPTTGMVSASAECFVFYYGYYRRGNAILEPGDTVRTVAKTPPNLMVYDEAKLAEGARPTAPAFRDGETRDTSAPEVPFDGGGKHAGAPPVKEAPTPTGTGKDATALDDQNGLLKPAEKEIPIYISDVFLDVAEMPELGITKPGAGRGEMSIFFRSPDGRLAMRLPAAEKASTLYKQVSASEVQGHNQGQPKVDEKKNEPTIPDGNRRRPPKERDDGGAGGG